MLHKKVKFIVFCKLLSYFLLRMSLAMYAAPFNDNSNNDNDDIINKKRTHNKTQKKNQRENFDTEKVNSVLEKIHNDREDEENELGDFNPPPKPESMGTQKRIATEEMETMLNTKNQKMGVILGNAPSPNSDNSDLDLNNYSRNYGDERSNREYYKKLLGNYLQANNQNQNQNQPQNQDQNVQQMNPNRRYYPQQQTNYQSYESINNDVLMQKLNYMINLLEEQQDERTNNVTEEVILYSFLGIFIIFIADSFAKVGKYVR